MVGNKSQNILMSLYVSKDMAVELASRAENEEIDVSTLVRRFIVAGLSDSQPASEWAFSSNKGKP